ncbi:MAG: TIGR00730 family Rossman fold protein [Elusimicrobia bacterium]|nr:TIGR00730 family Rossman fold protein [Elusimicrobiota bacterium]
MTGKICVFCGSNSGYNKIYIETAKKFAIEIVKNNFTLVYGGGKVGIMGILSNEIMSNGGNVIGVIPEFLNNMNLGNKNITEMKVVSDMHIRKKTMYELSDYFVALPGGIGTFEEITEILTWKQLNIHNKPCALLNINGFYDNYVNLLQKSVDEGFMKQIHLDNLIVEEDYTKIIDRLKKAKDKQESKFI